MYVYNELSSVQMSTYNQQNSFRGMVYETVDRKLRVDSNDVGNSVLRSIFFFLLFFILNRICDTFMRCSVSITKSIVEILKLIRQRKRTQIVFKILMSE